MDVNQIPNPPQAPNVPMPPSSQGSNNNTRIKTSIKILLKSILLAIVLGSILSLILLIRGIAAHGFDTIYSYDIRISFFMALLAFPSALVIIIFWRKKQYTLAITYGLLIGFVFMVFLPAVVGIFILMG